MENVHEQTPPGLFWTTEQVIRELGISRPTAYRLMHESGALVRTPRRLRVYVPRFLAYLRGEEADDAR